MSLFKKVPADDRFIKSAEDFLIRHDYVILAKKWQGKEGVVDIIATDKADFNCICFCRVSKKTSDKPFSRSDRKQFEALTKEYLNTSTFQDMAFRFDDITITPIEEGRAIIAHHVNALGNKDDLETLEDIFEEKNSSEIVNLLSKYEERQDGKKQIIYYAYKQHIREMLKEEVDLYKQRAEKEHLDDQLLRYQKQSKEEIEGCIEDAVNALVDDFAVNVEEYFEGIVKDIIF